MQQKPSLRLALRRRGLVLIRDVTLEDARHVLSDTEHIELNYLCSLTASRIPISVEAFNRLKYLWDLVEERTKELVKIIYE